MALRDMMDDGGYISTIDAVLALTVVFIITASLINTEPPVVTHESPVAGDVLDVMAAYPSGESILDGLAESPDPTMASDFLNRTLEGMDYNLTLDSGSGEVTVASRGSMEDAEEIDVAVRSRGNVTFRLYLWRS
ncbi:MAG: hypothetical protein NQU45_00185 [Methanothermobacter sp.]|jgi:hypothetical protein|nr:hypothetical protein [Methanothermobacter thermautotrophicus]MCQ8904125.1 hypothetical protein [Methanothermobacter sp.]